MADPKDARGFFRKVVNFVVNPGGDAAARTAEGRDSEFERSELKAMIERKRRNDFVRKRELDMLRKLRRQGLTPEQLAALGSSSGMADTESKAGDTELPSTGGMKAKIDEIEQQMVGPGVPPVSRRTVTGTGSPPPRPVPPPPAPIPPPPPPSLNDALAMADTIIQPDRAPEPAAEAPTAAPRTTRPSSTVHGLLVDSQSSAEVEVSEAAHDPDLDEAVIAYANGDNERAEALLLALIRVGGSRAQHAETWMVLFDLYRATGQQARFEPLALEFAQRLGRSAPQWFSVPRLIAEAQAQETRRPRTERIDGQVGWTAPALLDGEAVAQLRHRTLGLPLPWVFDWTRLERVEPDAAAPLLELLVHWTPQVLDMRWIAGERLLQVLAEAAPVGAREADPTLWRLRLQVLRMGNRPDRFDEVAIDYCVTYEMSPPSWEPATCRVRLGGVTGAPTNVAPTSVAGPTSTHFVESQIQDEPGLVQIASLELSGQLAGDIAEPLRRLDEGLGSATLVEVSCVKLLRVDFMASGDLLNWVLARGREGRGVSFVDTNRLVALFFSAIGIDAHASVKVRAV